MGIIDKIFLCDERIVPAGSTSSNISIKDFDIERIIDFLFVNNVEVNLCDCEQKIVYKIESKNKNSTIPYKSSLTVVPYVIIGYILREKNKRLTIQLDDYHNESSTNNKDVLGGHVTRKDGVSCLLVGDMNMVDNAKSALVKYYDDEILRKDNSIEKILEKYDPLENPFQFEKKEKLPNPLEEKKEFR